MSYKTKALVEESDSKEEKPKTDLESYIQWSVGSGNRYFPSFKTIKNVPAGLYEMKVSRQQGFYIEQQIINSDGLIELPIPEMKEILTDITTFWNKETMFKKYGYTHKRGILLYGPPGNGKTFLLQKLSRMLIEEHNGVVFNLKDPDAINIYAESVGPIFRSIEPDRPIIVIMEDIDNIMEYAGGMLSKVLNILDGVKQINKVVYLATTNYPERLQERLANRPSRFDRRYKIGMPNAAVRLAYIKGKLFPDDLKSIDLKKWIKDTQGFSMAAIKELIVSVVILGIDFDTAMERLKEMKTKITPLKDGTGFKGFGESVDKADYDDLSEDDYKKDYYSKEGSIGSTYSEDKNSHSEGMYGSTDETEMVEDEGEDGYDNYDDDESEEPPIITDGD